MTEAERDILIDRAKANRDRVVGEADATLKTAIASIKLVYDLANEGAAVPDPHAPFERVLRDRVPLPGEGADRQQGPAAAVRAIIADLPEFTTPIIVEASELRTPQTPLLPKQVSSVMNRFAETGEIVLVREGSGREPHTYRKGADGLAITVKSTNLSHTESEAVA